MSGATGVAGAVGGPGPGERALERAAAASLKSGPSPSIIRGGSAASSGPGREARLREATEEFEAVFIQEMLKAMRSTVPEGGLVDAGQSEEMFTTLLDEHVARAAADRSGGGLADALYRQFVGRLGG